MIKTTEATKFILYRLYCDKCGCEIGSAGYCLTCYPHGMSTNVQCGNNDYPRKYRKKSVVIEAMKYDGYNCTSIQDWIAGEHFVWPSWIHNYGLFEINTLEGKMTVSVGDYIIKGVKGEFYSCKPDVFEQTYDEVQE